MIKNLNISKHHLPWHLKFTADLEARYCDHFFRSNMPFIRLALIAATLAATGFTILSYTLLREGILNPNTQFIGTISLIAVPFLTISCSYLKWFRSFYHLVLFTGFISIFATILILGENRSESYRYSSYGAFLYLIMLSYGFPQHRFSASLLVGSVGSGMFFASAKLSALYTNAVFAQISTYFLLCNFIGFAISYSLQRSQRSAFLVNEDLESEHLRAESLLHSILPSQIANRLKSGQSCIADQVDSASVLFIDIVSFSEFTRSIKPEELVNFLDKIFSSFDFILEKYQVEKIKTIGDGYMAASGLLGITENHCARLATAALEILEFIQKDGSGIQLRAGIHTGPLTAGVVGRKKMIYDLWGETVNIASRMESHGLKGKIQVSEAVVLELKDQFTFTDLIPIDVKGQGVVKVAFLVSQTTDMCASRVA